MEKGLQRTIKIIIVIIAILIVSLIGVTYAYFSTTLSGSKQNVVRVGSLELNLTEGNALTLSKLFPIKDSEGLKQTGFSFSLSNTSNTNIDYTIYLDDVALSSGETRIANSKIRYSLTKNNVAGSPNYLSNMGTSPNRVVESGKISKNQTINYTLRLWIDYNATVAEVSNKVFKGELRVEAKQSLS